MSRHFNSLIRISAALAFGWALASFGGSQAQEVEQPPSSVAETEGGSSDLSLDGLKDLIGTWNLKGESEFGPMDHKLVVTAGGKVTYESNGQISEVTNLEIDGNKVSFEMTIFGGGNSYDVAFEGSFNDEGLTGDIITGGTSFSTLKAPRAPNLKDLIGTWNLKGESQFGPMDHKLVVTADGKFTYESSGQISEVTNLKINGNKVTFEMTTYGGGNSYDVAFEGSFNDEGLTGDIISGGASFATLKAPRAGGIKDLIGTWNLKGESEFGPMDHKLVVTADGKITYESEGQISEVTNLKIDGSKVSFEMTIFGGGNSYDVAFEGSFNGEGLTGDIMTGGTSFSTLKAPRK